jgi:hypothetical protein
MLMITTKLAAGVAAIQAGSFVLFVAFDMHSFQGCESHARSKPQTLAS